MIPIGPYSRVLEHLVATFLPEHCPAMAEEWLQEFKTIRTCGSSGVGMDSTSTPEILRGQLDHPILKQLVDATIRLSNAITVKRARISKTATCQLLSEEALSAHR